MRATCSGSRRRAAGCAGTRSMCTGCGTERSAEEWAADDMTAILHQVGAYTPPWLS